MKNSLKIWILQNRVTRLFKKYAKELTKNQTISACTEYYQKEKNKNIPSALKWAHYFIVLYIRSKLGAAASASFNYPEDNEFQIMGDAPNVANLSYYRYRKNTQNYFFFKYRYGYNDRSIFSSGVYLIKKFFILLL